LAASVLDGRKNIRFRPGGLEHAHDIPRQAIPALRMPGAKPAMRRHWRCEEISISVGVGGSGARKRDAPLFVQGFQTGLIIGLLATLQWRLSVKLPTSRLDRTARQ
jgi:hypothetical protein